MSAPNTLTMFPPPPRVPRVSLPNPSNRKPSLKTVKPLDSFKGSVVITMEELAEPETTEEQIHRKPIQGKTCHMKAFVGSNDLLPPPPPLPKSAHFKKKNAAGTTTTTTTVTTTIIEGSSSAQGSPEPESISSSETLVRFSQEEQEEPKVAIRSMFPVYNPNVPLSQQSYYPQRPVPTYDPSQLHKESSRPDLRSRIGAPRNNQLSIVDVPLDVLNFKGPTFSTNKDLQTLWELAGSSELGEGLKSFDLEMGRTEEATFVFGSIVEQPFYQMTTFDTSEVGITKTCPSRPGLNCEISLTTIEDPSRRLPPNDGLIAFVFPKLAAMMAINQSAALAEDYDLSPSDLEEIQEAAMKRAATQEASSLRWNAIDKHYEFEHPAISRSQRETNFVTSPLSPQGQAKPMIYITVATSEASSQDHPVILVTYNTPSSSSNTGPGLSAPGQVEASTEISLASLDFNTNTLHIEANNILETMPSLFAIDSVVSALIMVAVTDHNTNAVMGGMKISRPKPAQQVVTVQSPGTNLSPTGGAFYATIAEREEAEEEARAAAKNHRKSMRSSKSKKNKAKIAELADPEQDLEAGGRSWYGKSKVKKPKEKKQIVIGEFDLEKLTHYQGGTRQGQELPAVTRGAMTMMVSVLRFVVWILTSIVQFLCWLMVSVTRGVTSEKF